MGSIIKTERTYRDEDIDGFSIIYIFGETYSDRKPMRMTRDPAPGQGEDGQVVIFKNLDSVKCAIKEMEWRKWDLKFMVEMRGKDSWQLYCNSLEVLEGAREKYRIFLRDQIMNLDFPLIPDLKGILLEYSSGGFII